MFCSRDINICFVPTSVSVQSIAMESAYIEEVGASELIHYMREFVISVILKQGRNPFLGMTSLYSRWEFDTSMSVMSVFHCTN